MSKLECIPVHTGVAHPFTVEAAVETNGEAAKSDYREIRVGFFDPEKKCVADIFIGVSEAGEPRVMITAGDGEGDQNFTVFPLREREKPVENN